MNENDTARIKAVQYEITHALSLADKVGVEVSVKVGRWYTKHITLNGNDPAPIVVQMDRKA